MSAPQPTSPAFLRAVDLAQHLGVSRPHFYRKLRHQLTAYEIAGVPVFNVSEAAALVRPRTIPIRQTPHKARKSNASAS
jgi:hypothetical protein